MTAPAAKSTGRAALVLVAGLVLMVAALFWWLVYYAQWQGMFDLLDVKFTCIAGGSFECSNFQDFIGPSAIPVYSPWLLWLGVVLALVGLYLSRRNKAAQNG